MANSKILSYVSETASLDGSSQTSPVGSIHSTFSTATTVKGSITAIKKKMYLLKADPLSKCTVKEDKYFEKLAVHNEAIASYLSLR
ncbi:hypothetical protein Plec18167_001876 [Paecilomyces lecythidis]|uniref:Uncharacterized protein n=1 Tax=Paecilomyces lecythidis TaxID=3004212 RepID=A0ABR3YA78_9EURO